MTASDLVSLLAARHADDVFVPECKDGPTQQSSHRRLDAWAMKRSWSHPKLSGYEIKVSRSDFIRDDKWRDYLPLCNELWFVAPQGVIDPQELAPEVGLLVAATTGTRLFTKKRAVYREIEPPADLLFYVLMCRARIRAEYGPLERADRVEKWRNWLRDRDEYQKIGYEVRDAIRRRLHKLEETNDHLAELIKEYEEIRERIRELGFDPARAVGLWAVQDKLSGLAGGIPKRLLPVLNHLATEVAAAADLLKFASGENGGQDA